jgi:hypothetical protein
MNAFEDQAFREAVAATGRKRLIMGGLVTEVCLAFGVIEALKAGYEASFVTDAVGGRSQIAHRTAIDRLTAAGAVPNTAIALVCELFRDWATPLGEPGRELVNWYVNEVATVPDKVGFAEREKLRAQGQLAH